MLKNLTFTAMTIAFIATGLAPRFASAEDRPPARIELALEAVLAPEKGYDDNDNVQVVAVGYLPNVCYSLAESDVKREGDGVTVTVRQYAIRVYDGICADDGALPQHLAMAVPFVKEIEIGQLNATNYRIAYKSAQEQAKIRPLAVDVARVPTIDNLPYAAVSNATTDDITAPGKEVHVGLNGTLNSTCTEIDRVDVRKVDDTYVVLPVLKVRQHVLCAQVLRPFAVNVNLGKTAEGLHLVHVRSMNGKAVNRVFRTIK